MSKLTLDSTITLNDGNTIPALGYGVFDIKDPGACEKGTLAAIEEGYRHIDTAHVYRNEEFVGNAVAESGVPREEIFITTKTAFSHEE